MTGGRWGMRFYEGDRDAEQAYTMLTSRPVKTVVRSLFDILPSRVWVARVDYSTFSPGHERAIRAAGADAQFRADNVSCRLFATLAHGPVTAASLALWSLGVEAGDWSVCPWSVAAWLPDAEPWMWGWDWEPPDMDAVMDEAVGSLFLPGRDGVCPVEWLRKPGDIVTDKIVLPRYKAAKV